MTVHSKRAHAVVGEAKSTSEGVSLAELEATVLAHVRAGIGARLGRDAAQIDADRSFTALGLDSVLLLELSAKLTESFGVELADFAAYDHSTPAALARHVAELLTRPEAPPATHPEAKSEPSSNAETHASGMELPQWSSKSRT